MSALEACSTVSAAAGELLVGTATEATDWLLVEVSGSWGRDAVVDTVLPEAVRDVLRSFPGRAGLIRHSGRRRDPSVCVVRAAVAETSGSLVRVRLPGLDDLRAAPSLEGEPHEGRVVLVCTHGRRDACCARLGIPVAEALTAHLGADVWQASHLGGHRFAPNVVVLPEGIQLGRIPLERAEEVAESIREGRIPLDLYRGRVLYPAHVQAAEVAVRVVTGYDRVGDIRLVEDAKSSVTFATPAGTVTVRVERRDGPPVAASCGGTPEPTLAWSTAVEPAIAEGS